MGISNKSQQVSVSEPIPVLLGTLKNSHPFLFSSSTSIHLLGQDILEKYHVEFLSPQRGNNPSI